jgi:type I restriction enzyme S subunit
MKAGWEVKKLGEVCSLITRGIAPKYIESGGIRVLNQKCIRGHSINFDLARRNNLELKRVPDARLIEIGDVLINSTGTGTLGRVAQVLETPTEPTTVDTHVTIIRPLKGSFYSAFFGYMLIQIEDELIAAGQGTSGQTELPKKDLEAKFNVSYPTDLAEQKRIVPILDEAFEGLDRARENAEANLKNASDLRQSLLQKAFAGELT